jgi:acetolactate synthase-1/2/3 large subunit
LTQQLSPRADLLTHPLLGAVRQELTEINAKGAVLGGTPMHPLRIISDLQPFVTEEVTLALDTGSFYIWHSR